MCGGLSQQETPFFPRIDKFGGDFLTTKIDGIRRHFMRHRSPQRGFSRPNRPYRKLPWVAAALSLILLLGTGTSALAAESHKPVTIRFWNWWDQFRKPWMDKIIVDFQKEYPWITVKNEVQGWGDREAKVVTAFAAGVAPELMMVTRPELASLADKGAIIPITDWVKRDKLDLKIFYPVEVDAFRWDDELWSLPLPSVSGENNMFFYNTVLFEEVGLDPENPPKTWADFAAAAKKLTRKDGTGQLKQLGVRMNPQTFPPFLYTNNGTFLSSDRKKVTFHSNEGVEAFQYLIKDLVMGTGADFASQAAFLGASPPAGPFIESREAILSGHPSVIGVILAQAPKGFEWGVMPMPYNSRNPKSKSRGVAPISWGWGYAIPSDLSADKKEAAWLFLKYLTTNEKGSGYFMLMQGRPAPVRAFNKNPKYYGNNPNWDKIIAQLDDDVAFPVLPIQKEMLGLTWNILWPAIEGKVDPKQALQQGAEQVQRLLDSYWKSRAKK